jgi:hypothetical protein
MSYAQNQIKNQLAINQRNKDFGSFDVNNISAAQMNKLRTDVYGGFKTKATPKYETRGAGRDGMRKVQTGYDQTFNGDYYKNHAGWSAIGSKVGISNINSQNDVRQMYDFVNNYQAPAPAAATPAAAPAPLMPQISAASQKYQADAQALSDKIAQQQADFNASQAAAAKAKAIASANQARSGQTANLQIQPASSTPKTAGTQAFKKRNLLPTSKRRLTSGINLGTSNTLNI